MTDEVTSNTETNEGGDNHEAIQREAESQGWVPKEKYRGNEADWVDADTFVQRGRQILPILRKNNENLLKELQGTKRQLEEFKEAAAEFKQFQKESYERKAQEYEAQITNLKAARAQAISDGDGQRVNALDDAIDEAKDAAKDAKAAAKDTKKQEIEPPSTIDPELQSWLGDNDWFGKDTKLTRQANALGEFLRENNPNIQGRAFLDLLDKELREEFPEKFGLKKKTSTPSVESGSGRGPSGSGRQSYAALPDDAKKACDKFVKQGLMTREQYVADYAW